MDKYLSEYPQIMSISDVSKFLGVTKATVRELISERKLTAFRVGRLIKITKESLICYLENNTI